MDVADIPNDPGDREEHRAQENDDGSGAAAAAAQAGEHREAQLEGEAERQHEDDHHCIVGENDARRRAQAMDREDLRTAVSVAVMCASADRRRRRRCRR